MSTFNLKTIIFHNLTGASHETARDYISTFEGDFDAAINTYYRLERDRRRDSATRYNTARKTRDKTIQKPKLSNRQKISQSKINSIKIEFEHLKDDQIYNSDKQKITHLKQPKKEKTNSSSKYKGVTKHRVTGKYEAHLWDGSVLRPRTNRRGRRKGKQIYLGAFSDELQAARTYDMAAIHFWGEDTILNFALEDYRDYIKFLKNSSKQDVITFLRKNFKGIQSPPPLLNNNNNIGKTSVCDQ